MSLNSPPHDYMSITHDNMQDDAMDISPMPSKIVHKENAHLGKPMNCPRASMSAACLFKQEMSNDAIQHLMSSLEHGIDLDFQPPDAPSSPASEDAMDMDSVPVVPTGDLLSSPLLSAAPTITGFNNLFYDQEAPSSLAPSSPSQHTLEHMASGSLLSNFAKPGLQGLGAPSNGNKRPLHPKRKGPDKRPSTRQHSCKKHPADRSAPPIPPSKRKRTAGWTLDGQDGIQDRRGVEPPTLRTTGLDGQDSHICLNQPSLSPQGSDFSSSMQSRGLSANGYSMHSDRRLVEKVRNTSTSSVQYNGKEWLKDIVSDLSTLFATTGYWLSFVNVPDFVQSLYNPEDWSMMQPLLVFAGLALATLMKSSEMELGTAGRNCAAWFRDQTQASLETSWNSQWVDITLVKAALMRASNSDILFSALVHPAENGASSTFPTMESGESPLQSLVLPKFAPARRIVSAILLPTGFEHLSDESSFDDPDMSSPAQVYMNQLACLGPYSFLPPIRDVPPLSRSQTVFPQLMLKETPGVYGAVAAHDVVMGSPDCHVAPLCGCHQLSSCQTPSVSKDSGLHINQQLYQSLSVATGLFKTGCNQLQPGISSVATKNGQKTGLDWTLKHYLKDTLEG
ncbi:hypothetical protein BU15DRAFT_67440 [Melanogaster broomeanus]|nr:hypothetical protein BU15DRAFT_67440 [Melanogaster broomeanus]